MATVNTTPAEELTTRTANALVLLGNCVEINPQKRSGVPVLKGTRFTVAQLLAELADGRSISEIAEDFELDRTMIQQLLEGMAFYLDSPA